MKRFTAYISDAERDALERAADDTGTSANFHLRMAVRQYFNMPRYPSQMLHVTNETESNETVQRTR